MLERGMQSHVGLVSCRQGCVSAEQGARRVSCLEAGSKAVSGARETGWCSDQVTAVQSRHPAALDVQLGHFLAMHLG